MKFPVIFIVGPTGVGKTHLSLLIAEKINVEIVSADSRQLYKYMNIGTAKPLKEEIAQIPHHFIDILEPDEDYNAGKYSKDARSVINDIFDRGNTPVVVGGSGLYIKTLIDGISKAPDIDPDIIKKIAEDLKNLGLKKLYKQLKEIDPLYAGKISENDPQRITRALEVYLSSGIPFSQWHQTSGDKASFIPKMYGLTMKRDILYEKINRRVDKMLNDGLLEEVKSLIEKGYTLNSNSLNTVGYKEAISYLTAKISSDDMVNLIKRNSRHYAKRQLTWFKKDKRIQWFEISKEKDLQNLATEIVNTH